MGTVSVGDIITAAQYNDLQTRIQKVLGNGTGDYGYGETVTSVAVPVAKIVEATDMNKLYTDIVKCIVHQFGTVPTSIAELAVADIIGADASTTPDETIKGHNDYNTAIGSAETYRLNVAASQTSTESKITSQRTSAWGGSTDVITHTVSVTFPGNYVTKDTSGNNYTTTGADHMRHFFNAGGKITFSAALTGGSGSKYNDWNSMLTNMGTIRFGRTDTTATGTGTTSTIGYLDLTTSYQQIFKKTGSGVYAENDYNINARLVGTDTIQFRIQFRDDDAGDQQLPGSNPGNDGVIIPGPAVDENVSGTVTSYVGQVRATGSYVSVLTPNYSNDSTL
jgi:hypothetical protein